MTTNTKIQGLPIDDRMTALYCRLSVDDVPENDEDNESNSIKNQKIILEDYCKKNGITNYRFFTDDGISGTTFNRPGFNEMQRLVEEGKICTVIVKDLSRFGREQNDAGRYAQVIYPTYDVTFISLQEHVNSRTGEGMEIMPFYNIFNEMYASQTSQKIRQVWKTKSEHGERVSSHVAFGYKKSPDNKKQWIIDEPAAIVVKRIFSMCLDGMGPLQIARKLEEEKVLTPSAYYDSVERKTASTRSANPYCWAAKTVVHILENRQYTGCTVNFISTTVSYKVHKVIYNPVEKQHIIPNTQEAIISEELWLRVQEIRQSRRRNTKTGKTSLFAGHIYCADCKSKLHFCASKSLRKDQEYYRCASYKDGRGTCQIHSIKNVVLEQIVLEAISDFVDFVRCYEPIFLYMLAQKTDSVRQMEYKRLQQTVLTGERRIKEIDRLIESLYEDRVLRNVQDDRYQRMMTKYEKEQRDLIDSVEKAKEEMQKADQKTVDTRLLLKTVREITEVKELTPSLVNALIDRIEVHNKEKIDGVSRVKVDIYFNVIGMMDIPDQEKIKAIMKEIKENPQKFKCVA